MAHRLLYPVSLLILASLAACGADTTSDLPMDATTGSDGALNTMPGADPDHGAGVPITPGAPDTSFAGQVATGVCGWLLGCCTTLEQEDFVAGVTAGDAQTDTYQLTLRMRDDPSICRDLVKGHLLTLWRDADGAVAAGRAVYNEVATGTCLTSFEDSVCSTSGAGDLSRSDHPCHADELVTGLAEPGDLCTHDFECTDGGYCDVALGASFGSCRTWSTLGEPCNEDQACGPAGYCGGTGDFGVCAETSGDLAPFCNLHIDCGAGQYCATSTHACVEALPAGTVCQASPYCASGFCALMTSQTCESTRDLNALCTSDTACGDEGFCDEAPPDVQRCIALTQLGEGERCDLGAAICGEGLLCEDGLCVPRSSIGGPCVTDHYCPSNGWCDGGSCSPRSPVGGVCDSDGQCVTISWCSNQTCVGRIEVGLSCDATSRCASGAHCVMPDGLIGTCQPLPSAGSDCADGQCGEGLGCITYTGTCAARLTSGADCDRTTMCATTQLCASEGLNSSVCQAPDVVGLGEGCAAAASTCNASLYCNAGTCVAYAVSGEQCTDDEQCVAGTSCVLGACKTLGGAFASCDSQEDCANGLYCDESVQQCTPQKTVAQACTWSVECQGTLYCDTTSLTCAWKKSASTPCSKQDECQDGLYCNIAGSCATRLDVGQTCNVDAACLEGLGCIGGLCVGPASPGMPCDPVMGCSDGSVCNQTTGLCEALGTSGSACETNSNCISELHCGALSPTCLDRGDTGDACDTVDGCLPTLTCQVSGLCRARGEIGSGCTPNLSQCIDGALCDASGVCLGVSADRLIGEPCGDHAQCETNHCGGGVCIGICLGTL
jgi:hypothetical protein